MNLTNETDEEAQRNELEMEGIKQKKSSTRMNWTQKTKVMGFFRNPLITSEGKIWAGSSGELLRAFYSH
jgi:hypothetical protein